MPISDLTGPVTSVGSATAIADGAINVSKLSGELPIANGGTGQSTAHAAFNALKPDILVTYTGTPVVPIMSGTQPGPTFIPSTSGGGVQQTFVALDGPTSNSISIQGEDIGSSDPLTAISFDDLVSIIGNLNFNSTNVLTTISFPELKYISLAINGATSAGLTTLNFPKLEYVLAAITITGCPALTTMDFSALKYLGAFAPSGMSVLTTINLASLEYCYGAFSPSTMASLTTLSLPVLKLVGGNFGPGIMASITTISAPQLRTIGALFALATMASLTTVSLPAMVRYASTISIPSATVPNVSAFTMGTVGTLKRIDGATITLSGLKLPSSEVNAILALLVSLDGTGGTTLWGAGKTLTINGGTNGAPTGQGIIDKATLIGRGATVTTN